MGKKSKKSAARFNGMATFRVSIPFKGKKEDSSLKLPKELVKAMKKTRDKILKFSKKKKSFLEMSLDKRDLEDVQVRWVEDLGIGIMGLTKDAVNDATMKLTSSMDPVSDDLYAPEISKKLKDDPFLAEFRAATEETPEKEETPVEEVSVEATVDPVAEAVEASLSEPTPAPKKNPKKIKAEGNNTAPARL